MQGFYICGTYGSGPLMSIEQRKRVFELVAEQANGRVALIAHVGSASTDHSVELAQHAEKAGADAIASVPPYYYHHNDARIVDHFEALIQSVSVPVYAYDNPKTSGNTFTLDVLQKLIEMGLNGLKDSTFDYLILSERLLQLRGVDFDYIVGTEALFMPAFQLGVRACVSGLAICFPEIMVQLNEVLLDGVENAADLHLTVFRARDILHYAPTMESVHAVLEQRGIPSGYPKRPFGIIDATVRDKLTQELQNLGLLEV
ncbi:MAG: dihydrodipicolinate synthase family protein [Anaerolineales bacterium]